MTIHSPAKYLLPLGLLLGAEFARGQAPAVTGAGVFASPTGNVFELAEPIWAVVYFDAEVTVTGVPRLALTIGAQTRYASFAGLYTRRSPPGLLFRYPVGPADYDLNGISIGADALTLDGGTIRSSDGTDALLGLGRHALPDQPGRNVDGSRESTPVANGLLIDPPTNGDTFKLAETISVWVWFTRAVAVTGVPQLALTIGTETRYASFAESQAAMLPPLASSPDFAPRPVNFRYAVASSDRDEDGISVEANALTLNGGTIRIRGGTRPAALVLESGLTVSNSAGHKVDGESADEEDEETDDNEAPQVVGALAYLELDVGETAVVDVAAVFADADDDSLRYSAAAEGGVVALTISDGTVRVRGVRPGRAVVVVTAADPAGLTATTTFRVAVGVLLWAQGGRPAAPEGGTVVLELSLSKPLTVPISTRWRIEPDEDPATDDADAADYFESSGVVSLPPRETAATIEIAIADDEDIEPAREHFVVHLEPLKHDNVALARHAGTQAVIQEGVCDRTPAVRDELWDHVVGCHWPNPTALEALSSLDLSRRNIPALRPNDLLGLLRLRRLDLSGNALKALPAGLFTDLERLEEISLEDNPGAPFALTIELERLDAEPSAAGPAQLVARTAWAAPFRLVAALSASPAGAARGNLPATVEIAAGATMSEPFSAASSRGAPLVLRAGPAPLPTECEEPPCFRGFETVAGPALTLFRRAPRVLVVPRPAPLRGGDALRVPLAGLVAADPGDALRWQAASSNEALATVRIVDGALEVTPELASAGTAEITLVVTDTAGLSATLRFEVRVEFHWPRGPARGWRSTLRRLLPPPDPR